MLLARAPPPAVRRSRRTGAPCAAPARLCLPSSARAAAACDRQSLRVRRHRVAYSPSPAPVRAGRSCVMAAMAPAGYKASEPMLMWEALRQATDEARALSRPHAAHFMAG